jgi:isocitrate dehydrogenase
MKMTDGMFHRVFDEVAKEYPEIENEHWIVDIGAAKLADSPEIFDVIVMPNLYGDILSDVAAQIAGSVGLAGSANIGDEFAMFEAIHGSAPRRAGQNLANPSGLLLGSILMLNHIGQPDVAECVHNAWLKTIEDGIHTYDIYEEGTSKEKVGTKEFAQAVIARMGQKPEKFKPVEYKQLPHDQSKFNLTISNKPAAKKELVGVDVFLQWKNGSPNDLGAALKQADGDGVKLKLISNRGQKVYPDGAPETYCVDHWRCRYISSTDNPVITKQQIINLLSRVDAAGFDSIKTENLYQFDGERGYTLSQGE